MTSSGEAEGKRFTIPPIEEVRKHELAQGTNTPLLFNKHKEKSNEAKLDHVTSTVTTNVEVSMTTSSPVSTAVTSATTSTYCITVNAVQRQNPVVHFIRNIPVTFDDIIPDFVLGKTTCALFLR